jgi:plasmid stabilization system protein ParE
MAHRLAPQALVDLQYIWQYVSIDGGSIDAADKLIDSISVRFMLLSGHPFMGRVRDEDFGVGLRSFPVGEYVIVT